MARKNKDDIVRLSDFDINEDIQEKNEYTVTDTSEGTLDENLPDINFEEGSGEELSEGIENERGEKEGEGGKREERGKKGRKGKKGKRIVFWVALIVILSSLGGGIGYYMYTEHQKELAIETANSVIYEDAMSLYESKDYAGAIGKFKTIIDFRDSRENIDEVQEDWNGDIYDKADKLYENGEYEKAIELFNGLAEVEYLDSAERLDDTLATQRKEYIDLLGSKLYKINKYKELTYSVGAIVIDTWKKNQDKPIKEVSDKLNKVFKDRATDIRQIDIGFKGLEKQLGEINKLGGAEKAYESVMSLYELYKTIHSNVINPIGEFRDYEKKMREYSSDFDIGLERLYVEEPGIRLAYKAEQEADIEKDLKSGKEVIEKQV